MSSSAMACLTSACAVAFGRSAALAHDALELKNSSISQGHVVYRSRAPEGSARARSSLAVVA